MAPTLVGSAFRDIIVDTTLESGTNNGLIQLKAGQGASLNGAASNTGSVTLASAGSISTTATGGNIILESGVVDGDILLNGPISSAKDMSLKALGGRITQTAGSELTAISLEALARDKTDLRTNVDTISRAELIGSGSASGEDLTIIEKDEVSINFAGTDAGDFNLTTGGALNLGQFDVTKGHDVFINSGGAISSSDVSPDANIRANNVTITAAGEVEFVSDVNDLNVITTAKGDILINNQGGISMPLNLSQIMTHDGAIQIDTDSDLRAEKVVSQTSHADNSITLQTRELFGGSITLDNVNAGADGNVLVLAGGLNAGGPLAFGGTIQSDPLTTNRVVANTLTAIAGGWAEFPGSETINLRTDVSDLIARARQGGDPAQLGSQGGITIDEANDIRLRWVETVSGDISIAAGGDIVHQAVRAPNADILLQAGGSVTAQLDDAMSDGVGPLPAKLFGRNLTVNANDEIVINTTVDTLDASSLVAGDLVVTESDSAYFKSLLTGSGNIDVTVGEFDQTTQLITKGGNAIFGNVSAGATGGDNVKLTVYGQARSSGEVDEGGNLLPNDPSLAGAKIHAALLDASAYGRLDLVTNIDRLVGQTFEIGNVEFLEDDHLEIDSLISHSGSINVTAGNTITATFLQSTDDIDQPATFDINLHATAGDVLVDEINAGGGFNDIIILADLGNIEEVDPQDNDDTHESTNPGGIDLTGDHISLTAAGSIGSVRDLETAANSIEAHSTVKGDIEIDEQDDVELTDVDTQDGTIHFDTGGSITITDVESLTDSDRNDITIHNTVGDILIDRLSAGGVNGDVFLTSDTGGIDEVFNEDSDVDLIADHAEISAASSFGGNRAIETELNTVNANVHVSGGIGLNEETTITLLSLFAENGRIDLTAGNDIFALDVVTHTDNRGNSMSFDAGGTLWVDKVIAGASSDQRGVPATHAGIVMTAAIVDELGNDPDIDIRSALLSMEARSGNVASLANPFETTASRIRSVSNIGENSIQNFSDAPVTVTELVTNQGEMKFEQFGSTITIDKVRNNKGDTSIIHNGGGNMRVNDVQLGGGDLFLNVNDGGRLKLFNSFVNGDSFFQADEMDFPGPFDGVTGTGVLRVLHDNPLRGTFVNPYYGEEDLGLLLEVDVFSLARLDFREIIFLGNVLFFTPINSFFANVGSGNPANDTSTPTIVPTFTASRGSEGIEIGEEEDTQLLLDMPSLPGVLNFSPFGLAGFGMTNDSSSWVNAVENFDTLFREFFGYHSGGLEGLSPDLFDQLIEQLERLEDLEEEDEEVVLVAELSNKNI